MRCWRPPVSHAIKCNGWLRVVQTVPSETSPPSGYCKNAKTMPDYKIEIKGGGAFIRLDLSHRGHPEAHDYWDGNWVVARIQAEVQGFKADFTDQVHLGDVIRFYEEVLKLNASLTGAATLAVMEEYLVVIGTLDARGRLDWSVLLLHPVKRDVQLQFEFQADQSYLPELIQQIEDVLIEFQVRGQP